MLHIHVHLDNSNFGLSELYLKKIRGTKLGREYGGLGEGGLGGIYD